MLRPMTLEDLSRVLEIERESFSEPWSRSNFENEILHLEVSELMVAESDGNVIGYTVTWFLDEEVHLANIAVRNGFRERGVGKALVLDVMARAMGEGAAKILLEVRESNVEARKLYESLGFRAVGIRKNYYRKEKEDAILMQCLLRDVAGDRGPAGGAGL